MMLKYKRRIVNAPDKLPIGGVTLLGTTVKIPLDNAFPIEEIRITATIKAGATGPTLAGADNYLGIVKKVVLETNDNNKPSTKVNYSGIGLLELAEKVGLNLSRATRRSIDLCQGATIANNLQFRIDYRIPLVHPMMGEPLRGRCLLPVHLQKQAPTLTIDFEQAANMCSAGSIAELDIEIVLICRELPDQRDSSGLDIFSAQILQSGGFIDFDLVESSFNCALGQASEARIPVNGPGSYLGLLFRQYKGGATVTRDVVDEVVTLGNETKWDIEVGGKVGDQWRWKHLQAENDEAGVLNQTVQTTSPSFAGAVAANTAFQPAASAYLDFLGDGLDTITELGSVLDVNTPLQANLKVEVVGRYASVATNPSVIYYGGHRLYGDLSRFQVLKN